VSVTAIAYKNSAPVYSIPFSANNATLISGYKNQYFNLFTSKSEVSGGSFSITPFGTSNQSLQSPHSYPNNSDIDALILQPVIVNANNSTFFYQDVAIIQPSPSGITFGQPGFKDYVVVEATKNGTDWIPLKDGYNASANGSWLNAFNGNQPGTPSMQVDQNIDLKTKFKANDTLLFRFRLRSDNDNVNAWGWSIDNLFIQQPPTGIELSEVLDAFTVFPNPAQEKVTVSYKLKDAANVMFTLLDANGKPVVEETMGKKPAGSYEREWDLSGKAEGVYFVRLKTEQGMLTTKLILKK
jgi:hypothetical protein